MQSIAAPSLTLRPPTAAVCLFAHQRRPHARRRMRHRARYNTRPSTFHPHIALLTRLQSLSSSARRSARPSGASSTSPSCTVRRPSSRMCNSSRSRPGYWPGGERRAESSVGRTSRRLARLKTAWKVRRVLRFTKRSRSPLSRSRPNKGFRARPNAFSAARRRQRSLQQSVPCSEQN